MIKSDFMISHKSHNCSCYHCHVMTHLCWTIVTLRLHHGCVWTSWNKRKFGRRVSYLLIKCCYSWSWHLERYIVHTTRTLKKGKLKLPHHKSTVKFEEYIQRTFNALVYQRRPSLDLKKTCLIFSQRWQKVLKSRGSRPQDTLFVGISKIKVGTSSILRSKSWEVGAPGLPSALPPVRSC